MRHVVSLLSFLVFIFFFFLFFIIIIIIFTGCMYVRKKLYIYIYKGSKTPKHIILNNGLNLNYYNIISFISFLTITVKGIRAIMLQPSCK